MPVRSLNSSVLKWPDTRAVVYALGHWTEKVVKGRKDVLKIGYFGSYARGDWGVGSDLDMILVLEGSEQAFEERPQGWNMSEFPVPVNLLVYTEAEWKSLDRKGRFYKTMVREAVWVYEKEVR